MTVGTQHILTNYHLVTTAVIHLACSNRTNTVTIQKSKVMYNWLKSPVSGDIKNTIFSQIGNVLTHEDGIALIKRLTIFTTVTSL